MNDLRILMARVETHPEDRINCLVAADCYAEMHNVTYRAACKAIAKARRVVLKSREVNNALRLIARHSPRRRRLVNSALRALGFTAGSACTVYVESGRKPPKLGIPIGKLPAEIDPGPAITVGARWLLRVNAVMLKYRRELSDKRRGITRRK